MMYVRCLVILSLLLNTVAYADEDAEQAAILRKYGVSPQAEAIVRLKDRNAELSETNEHLSNANWGLIKSNQLLKEEIEHRDLLGEADSGSNGFLWLVIGIAAGGAAGYFGARSIK